MYYKGKLLCSLDLFHKVWHRMEYEAYETDETYDDMNVVDCTKTEVPRSKFSKIYMQQWIFFLLNVDLVVTE